MRLIMGTAAALLALGACGAEGGDDTADELRAFQREYLDKGPDEALPGDIEGVAEDLCDRDEGEIRLYASMGGGFNDTPFTLGVVEIACPDRLEDWRAALG